MSEVFISHSSKDKLHAEELVSLLEKSGVQCWIAPRNIGPGKKYNEAVVLQMERSRAFVVLLSKNAIESQNVESELCLAHEAKIPLFPVKLDAAEVPKKWRYFVALSQWIDADEPARSRSRSRDASRIARIAEAIRLAISEQPRETVRPVRQASVAKRRGEAWVGPRSGALVRALGRTTEPESAEYIAVKAAEAGMAARKVRMELDELGLAVGRHRDLSGKLAEEEAGLRTRIAEVQERRKQAQLEDARLSGCLEDARRRFEELRIRHGAILLRQRQIESSFDYCRIRSARVAREAFFRGDDRVALRIETARAISFPDTSCPPEFVDVFGFLASAFGLPSGRRFWDSVAGAHSGRLPPLQLYNRAVSRLFAESGPDCLAGVAEELDVVHRDLAGARGGDTSLSACIIFDSTESAGRALGLRVWAQAAHPDADERDAPRLADVVHQARSAIRRAASSKRAFSGCKPALLADIPFTPETSVAVGSLDIGPVAASAGRRGRAGRRGS